MSPHNTIRIGAAMALLAANAIAAPVQAEHVGVELVSETTALVPGRSAWIGLRLTHEPHWHTYWTNPGDSGLATKLTWTLPADFRTGDIEWPTPRRFDVGGLFNFGYDGDALLPVQLDVPTDAKRGSTARLAVEARWLVCREECIPGKSTLTLDLPIAAEAAANPRSQAAFAAAGATRPRVGKWTGTTRVLGDQIEVSLRGAALPSGAALDAFVVQRQIVGYAPPRITRSADTLTLSFAKSEYFTSAPAGLDLLLVDGVPPAVRSWSAHAPFTASKPTP